jgi:hypothetical protein
MVVRRRLLIAAPFVLIVVGGALFYLSPWPAIVHLMLTGARVRIALRWSTVGQPLLALACWVAATALSLRIKRE